MKKLLSLLLAVACVFSALPAIMMPNVSATLSTPETYRYARYIGDEKITVDGVLDESFYSANGGSDWYDFMIPLNPGKDKNAFYYNNYSLFNIIQLGNDHFDVKDQLNGGNQWWMNPCDNFSLLLDPNNESTDSPADSQFLLYYLVTFSDDMNHTPSLKLDVCGKQVVKLADTYQINCATNFDPTEHIITTGEDQHETIVPGEYALPNGTWDIEIEIPFELLNHPHSKDNPDALPMTIRPYKTTMAHAIWYREVRNGVPGVWNDASKPSQEHSYSAEGAMHNSFNHNALFFMKSDGSEGPGTEPNPPYEEKEYEYFASGEAEDETARPDYTAIDLNSKSVAVDGTISEGEYKYVTGKEMGWKGVTLDASYEEADYKDITTSKPGEKYYENDVYSYAYDEKYLYMAVKTSDTKIVRKKGEKPDINKSDYVIFSVDPNAEFAQNMDKTSKGIKFAVMPSIYNEETEDGVLTGGYGDIAVNDVLFMEQGIDIKVIGDGVDLSNKATGIIVADNAKTVSKNNPWTVEVAIPWKYLQYTSKDGETINKVKKHKMQFKTITYNYFEKNPTAVGNGVSEGSVTTSADDGLYYFKEIPGVVTEEVNDDKILYEMDKNAVLEKMNDHSHVFEAKEKNKVEIILPIDKGLNKKGYGIYAVDFGANLPVAKFNTSLFARDWYNVQNSIEGSTVDVTENDKAKIVVNLITANDIADAAIKEKALKVYGAEQKLIQFETYIIDEFGNETKVVPSAPVLAEFNLKDYSVTNLDRNGVYPVVLNPQGVQVSNVSSKLFADEFMKYTENEDGDLISEIVTEYRYLARYADNPIFGIGKFEAVKFADLEANKEHWSYADVEQFSTTGIIKGEEALDAQGNKIFNYNPDNNITREQSIWLIGLVFGFSTNTDGVEPFTDVSKDSYAYNVLLQNKAMGIVNGDEEGRFNPESSISRREFVTMIGRSIEKAGTDLKVPLRNDNLYGSIGIMNDKNKIFAEGTDWSWDYIESMMDNKIMSGAPITNDKDEVVGYTFNPDDPITRAEATKIFNKFLRYFVFRNEKIPD